MSMFDPIAAMNARTELANRFQHHPPRNQDEIDAHEAMRARCFELAQYMFDTMVHGREYALAITNLEQVLFWANAGLARNKVTGVPDRRPTDVQRGDIHP